MEGPNTITTEITSGPRPGSGKPEAEGPSPKARKLLGWFRRASIEEQKHKKSIQDEQEGGMNDRPSAPSRVSRSTDGAPAAGITVQYDVRRMVEDVRGGEDSTSSQSGDCITCIEEESVHRKDDLV